MPEWIVVIILKSGVAMASVGLVGLLELALLVRPGGLCNTHFFVVFAAVNLSY